jgi:hypothetical protein
MKTIREIGGAIGGFILKMILWNLLIILYPVLVFMVPLWAIHTGDHGTIRVVSFFYLMFGPLCAGFWFLFASHFPKQFAAQKRGETLDTWNLPFHFAATGKMFLGIILSYLCTFGMASQVSHVASPLYWFLAIGAAQNFPTLLMILLGNRKSNCVCNGKKCFNDECCGTIRRGACNACGLNYSVV